MEKNTTITFSVVFTAGMVVGALIWNYLKPEEEWVTKIREMVIAARSDLDIDLTKGEDHGYNTNDLLDAL